MLASVKVEPSEAFQMQGCSLHLRCNNLLQAPMQHIPFWMVRALPEGAAALGVTGKQIDATQHFANTAHTGQHHAPSSSRQLAGLMLVLPASALGPRR